MKAKPPEAVVLMGLPGAGKSTFCRERFFRSHVRINLDMLRTRRREQLLLRACLEAQQSFVIDNTNPERADRARYLVPARAAGFHCVGYWIRAEVSEAMGRNAQRSGRERVPDAAVRGTARKFEAPEIAEGFDALYAVVLTPDGYAVTAL
jgi:predicted kinase